MNLCGARSRNGNGWPDKHNGEDKQLQQAVEHRRSLDRTAEVHAREAFTRSNGREQVQEREQGRGRVKQSSRSS